MTYLQLGKNGDLTNILPACAWNNKQTGERQKLIVDVAYRGLMEGISYVEPLFSPYQDYRCIEDARRWAYQKDRRQEIVVTQVRGKDWYPEPRSASYALDSRMRCRVPDEAWERPVVFDRRDAQREAELAARLCDGRPLVLVNTKGHSSPFPDQEFLIDLIRSSAGADVQVLDIGKASAHRLYDLLGLYDRAAALVTVDTATLHLAAATPKLPVIAFISDRGNPWAGTIPLPTVNLLASIRYQQFRSAVGVVAGAIQSLFLPKG